MGRREHEQERLSCGLVTEGFSEYPHGDACRMWNEMREIEGGRFVPPARVPRIPLMYGVAAAKPV